MMYNCAVDWTFDLALADARKASVLPLPRGVRRPQESEGVQFFTWLKTVAANSVSDTPWDDSWERDIDWGFVSDVYKDIYGQRPHFSNWYWRGLLDVYQPFVDFTPAPVMMQEKADCARMVREGTYDR